MAIKYNKTDICNFCTIKKELSEMISKIVKIPKEEIEPYIIKSPSFKNGDLSFPCFSIVRKRKKSLKLIVNDIVSYLKKLPNKKNIIDRVEAIGGYVNFYLNREIFSDYIFKEIFNKKERYGNNDSGKRKKVIIEMSSPNIAKSFGIGHLRSTIIGESLSKIYTANGYKTIKINYLGDWGTQFGILIYGIKKERDLSKIEKKSINYFQNIYVKINSIMNDEIKEDSKKYFKLMEEGDKKTIKIWKKIREDSVYEFNKIYNLLGVSFDIISGESYYGQKGKEIVEELLKKKIAKISDGSVIIDLEKEGKSVGVLKKSDGTTTYLSREISAAIDRKNRFNFDKMIYEVGSEQKLHFQQLFRILEKMGYKWSNKLKHISHGLYLGKDGKKLSTRQGSNIDMIDIWKYTSNKVTEELKKRKKNNTENKDIDKIKKITRAAIIYGDISNYREKDIKYNLNSMISMEGDTGPYLLYSYARCKSILRKLNYSRYKPSLILKPIDKEYKLISKLSEFPDVIIRAGKNDDPSIIAKYSMSLAKEFNSFYSECRIKGSDREEYRALLIKAYSLVLKNSLDIIGINTIEKM